MNCCPACGSLPYLFCLVSLPAVTRHGAQVPHSCVRISKIYEAVAPSCPHPARWCVEKVDMIAKTTQEQFLLDLSLAVPEGYVAQHDGHKPLPIASISYAARLRRLEHCGSMCLKLVFISFAPRIAVYRFRARENRCLAHLIIGCFLQPRRQPTAGSSSSNSSGKNIR